ncbi:MAG: hypothetical protein WC456_01175 [Patescibacteria group bacterium]
MEIVINTAAFNQFLNLPPDQMVWVFWRDFGWLILSFVYLFGVRELYLLYIRQKWELTHKNMLLAIDIPRGNEQSPKAVENIFTYLAGAHGSINFFEKWFEGKFQKTFSFEIVSLEGYTQFLIWTPVEHRNLVESAVYSQYPDAEISEVDDYVGGVPQIYPDEEYDIWGTEFLQAKPWVYPIKSYLEFEHPIGPSETQFKDPMASLMDLCGSLRQGEQLWFQMIVIPIGFDWVKESEKEINKIMGRKEKSKPGATSKLIEWMGDASEKVYSIWGDIDSSKKEEKARTMMDLTPLEKKKVEGVQMKASKLGFEAKFRAVYIAKKEVMNRAKVMSGMVGFMKQFAALDLNNMKPDIDYTFTKTVYFFTAKRLAAKKRKVFRAYINRSDSRGRTPGLYNIEELATIWHFPIEANVKAAMVQKAPGRKADAPASLPLAEEKVAAVPDIFSLSSGSREARRPGGDSFSYQPENRMAAAPASHPPLPPNLPFV